MHAYGNLVQDLVLPDSGEGKVVNKTLTPGALTCDETTKRRSIEIRFAVWGQNQQQRVISEGSRRPFVGVTSCRVALKKGKAIRRGPGKNGHCAAVSQQAHNATCGRTLKRGIFPRRQRQKTWEPPAMPTLPSPAWLTEIAFGLVSGR